MSEARQLVRNAADAEQVAKAGSKEKRQRARYLHALANVMATRDGRIMIWQQLADCGIYRNSFDNSGSVTAFNCGIQSRGQAVLAEIMEACPTLYLTMQTEAQREQENENG